MEPFIEAVRSLARRWSALDADDRGEVRSVLAATARLLSTLHETGELDELLGGSAPPAPPDSTEAVGARDLLERAAHLPTLKSDASLNPAALIARQSFPRAYESWSEDEDRLLVSMHRAGLGPKRLSSALRRQPSAISLRLLKLAGEAPPAETLPGACAPPRIQELRKLRLQLEEQLRTAQIREDELLRKAEMGGPHEGKSLEATRNRMDIQDRLLEVQNEIENRELDLVEGDEGHGPPEPVQTNFDLTTLAATLRRTGRRATYGAVAGLLGLRPYQVVSMLKPPSREKSFIVARATGLPIDYPPSEIHPDVRTAPLLGTTERLQEWLGVAP